MLLAWGGIHYVKLCCIAPMLYVYCGYTAMLFCILGLEEVSQVWCVYVYISITGSANQTTRDQSVRKNRPDNPVFTPPPPPDTPPPEEDDLAPFCDIERSSKGGKSKNLVEVADSSTQVHVTPRDSLSSGKSDILLQSKPLVFAYFAANPA